MHVMGTVCSIGAIEDNLDCLARGSRVRVEMISFKRCLDEEGGLLGPMARDE
jgi:hypothetical protein